MCRECPLIGPCAALALMAGTSLDGSRTGPAEAVIQAGVICRGDDATATALARIAGVPVPVYRAQRPRPRAPKQCMECREPMVSWTRGEVPPGKVMHHGRGYCTGCREAYKRARRTTTRGASRAQRLTLTPGMEKPPPDDPVAGEG